MGTSPEQEFSEFVAARGPALFRVALALTGSHHAAEDLLQSVLERTFARWRQIRISPEGYARTALYRTGQFVGWGGPTTVLMVYDNSIDAFDFATGVRRPLHPVSRDTMLDGQLAMVVVAADGLSDRARGRVGF